MMIRVSEKRRRAGQLANIAFRLPASWLGSHSGSALVRPLGVRFQSAAPIVLPRDQAVSQWLPSGAKMETGHLSACSPSRTDCRPPSRPPLQAPLSCRDGLLVERKQAMLSLHCACTGSSSRGAFSLVSLMDSSSPYKIQPKRHLLSTPSHTAWAGCIRAWVQGHGLGFELQLHHWSVVQTLTHHLISQVIVRIK